MRLRGSGCSGSKPAVVQDVMLVVNAGADPRRRALFDEARRLQRVNRGVAGAEHLFGAAGLPPEFWGVSKPQLKKFREEVKEAIRKGTIRGQPDSSLPFYCEQLELSIRRDPCPAALTRVPRQIFH